jgi:hypothetical protein
MDEYAVRVIDLLGGTGAVAELCDIKPPSVSGWKRNGIPKAQLNYLRAIRPDVFNEVHNEVTPSAESSQAAA